MDGVSSSHDRQAPAKIIVATTVALSFISFWRAAAIVLSDLASSAFYAGGIAEQAIGKSAPWFILGVMLFSFAVRSVYMESSSMFVRGGVYVVVRDAMGPFVARLSVSSLIFDYILTGPISVVSAGQYLGRLLNEISELVHNDFRHLAQRISPLVRHCGHHLFLVEQHQGHSRIERQGAAHHADHHRDGGGVSDLVPDHASDARPAHICRPRRSPRNLHFSDGRPGLVQGHHLADDSGRGHHHRVRPLPALDERLRNAGAGLPRNRLSQAART